MSKLEMPLYLDVDEDDDVFYPSSDGAPMGENTTQFKWIIALYNGFQGLFHSRNDVFIASNLFWYPVKGNTNIVTAPDVMIAFGRPPGERLSYMQWKEDNVPFQIVIEITSPSNNPPEMAKKFDFYQRYGVEEYYIYDPAENALDCWIRKDEKLSPVKNLSRHVSPRTGISFDFSDSAGMRVIDPEGKPFASYIELIARHAEEQERAELERKRAEQHKRAAEAERTNAEAERANAEAERARAISEKTRADALAAKLRELGIDPDRL